MSMQTLLRALLRNWWLIALSTLLTTGSTAYFVSRQAPIYRAETAVEVRPSTLLTDPRQVVVAIEVLNNPTMANTIARKVTTSALQNQVAGQLGITPAAMADANLSAVVLPQTNLIEIRAQSTSPQLAAAITNAVAEQLSAQTPADVVQIAIVDRATPPSAPSEPGLNRFIVLAILFGLALGVVFALIEQALQMLHPLGRWRGAAQDAAQPAAVDAAPAMPVEPLDEPTVAATEPAAAIVGEAAGARDDALVEPAAVLDGPSVHAIDAGMSDFDPLLAAPARNNGVGRSRGRGRRS